VGLGSFPAVTSQDRLFPATEGECHPFRKYVTRSCESCSRNLPRLRDTHAEPTQLISSRTSMHFPSLSTASVLVPCNCIPCHFPLDLTGAADHYMSTEHAWTHLRNINMPFSELLIPHGLPDTNAGRCRPCVGQKRRSIDGRCRCPTPYLLP
jgi:hypothetical protein